MEDATGTVRRTAADTADEASRQAKATAAEAQRQAGGTWQHVQKFLTGRIKIAAGRLADVSVALCQFWLVATMVGGGHAIARTGTAEASSCIASPSLMITVMLECPHD